MSNSYGSGSGFGAEALPLAAWADVMAAGTAGWISWATAASEVGFSYWTNALGRGPLDTGFMYRAAGMPSRTTGSWYRSPNEWGYGSSLRLPAEQLALEWWRSNIPWIAAWPAMDARGLGVLTTWASALATAWAPFTGKTCANPLASVQPWMQFFWAWPFAQGGRAEIAPIVPFASYRSDGGHATAQVTFPRIVVATPIWPVFGIPFWSVL